MNNESSLILSDGSIYKGKTFGAQRSAYGEVVFNTGMTGYQEMLTDPSYAGQIVVLTYPLVGNYGINPLDFESDKIQVAGFVVKDHCTSPSHRLSTTTLDAFLVAHNIPGLSDVDTRAIARHIRSSGVMMGAIRPDSGEDRLTIFDHIPNYSQTDFVQEVTTRESYDWHGIDELPRKSTYKILVTDWGVKFNIPRLLHNRGCRVTVVPAYLDAEELLSLKPDGIVLSPGPGNPGLLDQAVHTTRKLLGRVPLLGICLGHQILARSVGAQTFKLKFGHRGSNHPVKDLRTGIVYITAQNHGYAVDPKTLPPDMEISHINLHDNTVEGLRHNELGVITIQYHTEASPGPMENQYIFDEFLDLVQARYARK